MMKKIFAIFIVLMVFASCKKELVKEPKRLIDKEKMVNIIYDLALLDAMNIENSVFLDSFKGNPNQYIYKKYQIDSIQFVQSNSYYAADNKEYEKMYSQVKARLEKEKAVIEAEKRNKVKQAAALAKKKEALKAKRLADSITKAKLKKKKETDSVRKSRVEKKKS